MFSIAIYSDVEKDVIQIKSFIEDFLIKQKIIAKVSLFNNEYKFLTAPSSFDIYIMDMDSKSDVIDLGLQMREIDCEGKTIYIGTDVSQAYLAAKARADYYLEKPLNKDEFLEVLKELKQHIQDDLIIIKTPRGERRVRANHLNYINIVKRCLCYHLADGTMFDGQTLRTSFEKAINPLQKHKAFLFISPSLLINIGAIKIVNKDNIVFENDEVLFFPMKQYENIRNTWINYSRILD